MGFVNLQFFKRSMNLIIDVGNTFLKLAVFEGETILRTKKIAAKDLEAVLNEFEIDFPEVAHAIVSSVANLSSDHKKAVTKRYKTHFLSHSSKIPFKNNYKSPTTLGVDRMALVSGARYMYTNQNVLVIDAGSCITYDFIDKDGVYYGGAIAPGLEMRYKSLEHFTAKLPLIEHEPQEDLIGTDTKTSILSGIQHGIVSEVDGIITRYLHRTPHLTVILTGGDMQFLSKRLKNSIFANPKLLLVGLNYILELNKYE